MNELPEVRALRADVPLPDADRLAAQRATLTRAFREEADAPAATPTAIRRPRRRLVLVTAATTAALAATGGLVASLSDDGPARTSPAAKGSRVLSPQASADALALAAATVEKHTTTEPRPKQWVYEKSTSFDQGTPRSAESWTRWDGTGWAHLPGIPPAGDISGFDPNELQVVYGPNQEEKWKKEGYDDRSQRQFYRFLATLPSDPDRMMKRIRQEHAIGDLKGETTAQRDWREIDVLYRSVLIPPNVQAGLFRAMAKIPGTKVETGVKDPLGRAAIAVTVDYAKPTPSGHQGKQEIFFDPETYAYLGEIWRAAPFEDPDGAPSPAGVPDSLTNVTARAAWGVVDKPGARP